MKFFSIIGLVLIVLCGQLYSEASVLEVHGRELGTGRQIEIGIKGKKGIVLVFLSATCPCSNSHVPELISLFKQYPEFNFVAIHSNQDESKEMALKYFKTISLPFPVIDDLGAQLADEYKAFKTPHAFVILPDGQKAYQGGVSSRQHFDESAEKFLRLALEDIKNSKEVKISQGRTLGCAISREKDESK